MRNWRCGGFTLLEIMAALAIVLALAAILYSVGLSAVGAAKSSACISNLSSIWKAVSLYTADHDGLIPPHAFEQYSSCIPNQPKFKQLLSAYGAVDNVFYCPVERHARTTFQGEYYSYAHTTYWMAYNIYFNATCSPGGELSFHIDSPSDPLKVLYFCDQPWLLEGEDGSVTRQLPHPLVNGVYLALRHSVWAGEVYLRVLGFRSLFSVDLTDSERRSTEKSEWV